MEEEDAGAESQSTQEGEARYINLANVFFKGLLPDGSFGFLFLFCFFHFFVLQ
jgi:hypothetical protein